MDTWKFPTRREGNAALEVGYGAETESVEGDANLEEDVNLKYL